MNITCTCIYDRVCFFLFFFRCDARVRLACFFFVHKRIASSFFLFKWCLLLINVICDEPSLCAGAHITKSKSIFTCVNPYSHRYSFICAVSYRNHQIKINNERKEEGEKPPEHKERKKKKHTKKYAYRSSHWTYQRTNETQVARRTRLIR